MRKENLHFDNHSFSRHGFPKEIENMFSVFLSSFNINVLAFYHECRSLIGYATHYLFCDKADLHGTTFPHTTSLRQVYDMNCFL